MRDDQSESKPTRSARLSVFETRPEYERLGRWLRQQREAVGAPQKPTSAAIGKPEQFLTKVENGRQRLDLVEFLDLVRVLRLDPRMTIQELLDAAKNIDEQDRT